MNRRDLLKYFGVGASVIPIIGGAPQPQIEAKLIEEPNIEITQAKILPKQPCQLHALGKQKIMVTFIDEHGAAASFAAQTFITKTRMYYGQVYYGHTQGYGFPDNVVSVGQSLSWELEGTLIDGEITYRP